MTDQRIQLKVTTTTADFNAYYAYVAANALKSWKWLCMIKDVLLWAVLTFTLLAFFQYVDGNTSDRLFFSVVFVGLSFIGYVLLSKMIETSLAKAFAPNDNGIMIGAKTFEISADGIKESHRYGDNFYLWDAVERVETVNDTIYVFVDKALALIFNAEAFDSQDEQTALFNILQRYAAKTQ